MTHLWVRAEPRAHERRVGLTPQGAASLLAAGFDVTVEASEDRIIATSKYADAGCTIAPEGSWPDAPDNAIIFGLKELPDDGTPLHHRHIMFGHAFKDQSAGRILLDRFKAGGGTLLDLEYLTDDTRRRVAAFGYWAGFAGAAVTLKCWIAQQQDGICPPVSPYETADEMTQDLSAALAPYTPPDALIIGALGRVGTGASDLLTRMGVSVTGWDMAETAHGGPFPEILRHDLFINCILANAQTPAFVRPDAPAAMRDLRVIGDIACDPDSPFNPVQVYDTTTTWEAPATRVHDTPPLDVMAIDNLPSMLPLESSEDYAAQLLPTLSALQDDPDGIWARAAALFAEHRNAA
ncbi:saccharopine dehydrogenase [Sulfitobacter sp. TSTF-M16]|uniref:Saccharopine dehydrogenase [NAD(+), L-lysine-forming] n=1 Tax=Sulfitobacter aestuariivivens TaxID=2766981 RepID=A0A927D7F3_9RHOB|nr:saccharopine dehydrogenase [Sulfitobacter aestuariivivens]